MRPKTSEKKTASLKHRWLTLVKAMLKELVEGRGGLVALRGAERSGHFVHP